jgi:hypothetical protein
LGAESPETEGEYVSNEEIGAQGVGHEEIEIKLTRDQNQV